MNETMKKYIKPSMEVVSIQSRGMTATSLNMGEAGSGTTDTDLTRKKRGGFGSGLWSDMQ